MSDCNNKIKFEKFNNKTFFTPINFATLLYSLFRYFFRIFEKICILEKSNVDRMSRNGVVPRPPPCRQSVNRKVQEIEK